MPIVLTDVGGVVRRAKDELWGSVISRANIADVRLARHQNLCRSEITEFQNACSWIEKEILWLDVSVAYADRMDVSEGAQQLVHVELDLEHWHGLFEFCIVTTSAVNRFGNIFQHKVEIDFVLLYRQIVVNNDIDQMNHVCLPCHRSSKRMPVGQQHWDERLVS